MARFLYKAKNNKGQIVTGTVRASNQSEAEKIIFDHAMVPTEIIAEQEQSFASFFTKKVSVRDKAVFSRQLATMLSSGLALTKAISLLATQARTAQIKEIFLSIYKDLEEGYSFSSSLAKHPEAFDRVFVTVVNSGENTGKLDVVLLELSDQLEKDSGFISKVKSALYYPAFVFGVLIIAGIVMLTFIVPKLEGIFDSMGTSLPLITRILISLSAFFQSWWWLVIILLVAGIIFILNWIKTDTGMKFYHNLQITVPGLKNLYEGMYMYRFTRTMAMLVGAGVPLLDALRIGSAVIDNVVYEDSLSKISSQVEKGIPLSVELLKDPFFPPLVGQMVAVGEETGELDKVLKKVSEYYEETTTDVTKTISSLVEPAVLVIVGLAVAFMVFAIYLPIYQMNTTIGQ